MKSRRPWGVKVEFIEIVLFGRPWSGEGEVIIVPDRPLANKAPRERQGMRQPVYV